MVYAKCSKCSSRWLLPRKDIGTKTECCIGGKYLQDNFVRKIIPKQEPIQEPKKEIPLKSKEEYERISKCYQMTKHDYLCEIGDAISNRKIHLFWRLMVVKLFFLVVYLALCSYILLCLPTDGNIVRANQTIVGLNIGCSIFVLFIVSLIEIWVRGGKKYDESLFKKRIKKEE